VAHWINVLQVDPHSRHLQKLLEKLSILDDRRLKELSVAHLFIQPFSDRRDRPGTAKALGEYLTIVSTASLLPLELYELANHASIGKGVALAINLAVVAYLISELRRFPKLF